MSLVRFAMVCDKCKVRQEEYAGYLSCRECGEDVCEKCCAEYDPDPPGHAVCKQCADEKSSQRYADHGEQGDGK